MIDHHDKTAGTSKAHVLLGRLQDNCGSIAVEYALCMILATILMTGVLRLFKKAIEIVVHNAIHIVTTFPSI